MTTYPPVDVRDFWYRRSDESGTGSLWADTQPIWTDDENADGDEA